jgi:hypothetical protein
MSFKKCIDDLENGNQLTRDQAEEVREVYEQQLEFHKNKMSDTAAEAEAGKDAFNAIKNKKMHEKRRKIMQMRTVQGRLQDIDSYTNRLGQKDPNAGAIALYEQDNNSKFSSVAQREEAILGFANANMHKILSTFRRNVIGNVRNKAKFKNLVREAFGENTGDVSAKELAQAWTSTHEMLRKRFNRAGGNIAKKKNYGFPQIHNRFSISKAGREQWKSKIAPLLNQTEMLDQTTGLPLNDLQLEIALNDVYDSIIAEGFNKIKKGPGARGKSLANTRQDHRFLIFKNADSWMKYQEEFGDPNVFDTMVAHTKNMSRDIAMMEILGPNPDATTTFIKNKLIEKAKVKGISGDIDLKAENAARRANKKIDEMYKAVTGRNNAPINGIVASTFAGLRQVIQSAQLGATSLAAITDINFQRLARQFSGLNQTRTLQQYLEFVNPLNAKEKGELAISSGLIAEGWTSLAAGQMRYVGDMSGPEITRRVSDFVMRASFLSPFTTAGRWAFGMEFQGSVARMSNRSFADLEKNFKDTLQRYNINQREWDIIRATTPYDEQGAKFIRPTDIIERTDMDDPVLESVATRYLEMINTETNFAVPSNSIRGRTFLTGETQPGTFTGETLRSVAMYKNFGVTVVNTHLLRGMTLDKTSSKGGYYANLLISTTLMGALAMQLKEISKGRDPRDMFGDSEETAKFWFAAFLQGGGLGIFGDFLFSGTNRFDASLGETIAGPVFSFGSDLQKLTIDNLYEAATGQNTNAAGELVKFTQRYLPGSSLWYARLALERKVWDQLQLMTDPKARSKFRRAETKYRRDFGQKYWWGPGDTAPTRAPRYSAAIE